MRIFLLFIFILSVFVSNSQEKNYEFNEYLISERTPDWIKPIIEKAKLSDVYSIIDNINPFYLEADFNGDKLQDIAIFIENKKDKHKGILIIHRGSAQHFILGASKEYGLGNDMAWVNVWYVYRDKTAEPGVGEKQKLTLSSPAIRITKTESGGGIIYWNGKEYKYFHQSC